MPRDGQATRTRILDAAQRLVADHGYAATSVDQVLGASESSKGAFFHHFDSKLDLARALVDRYVAADLAQLDAALDGTAEIDDPRARAVALVRWFEDRADEITDPRTTCLYIAVLTERQLLDAGASEEIVRAVLVWRERVAQVLRDALTAAEASGADLPADLDAEDLADHLFVTFEGSFLLCRALGDEDPMRRQLGVLRRLLETTLGPR